MNNDGVNDNGMESIDDREMEYIINNEDVSDSEMTSVNISHASTSSCLLDSPIVNNGVESHDQDTTTATTDLQKDILVAVLKAFELLEESNASQKSIMNILNFGRDLYCRGDTEMINKWPSSWSACLALLRMNGYKEPVTYYICIIKCSTSHPMEYFR